MRSKFDRPAGALDRVVEDSTISFGVSEIGAEGVFVGSGIFKSGEPAKRARAIVEATTHYMDAEVLARVSEGLGEAMVGISTASLDPSQLLETRGW